MLTKGHKTTDLTASCITTHVDMLQNITIASFALENGVRSYFDLNDVSDLSFSSNRMTNQMLIARVDNVFHVSVLHH